MTRATITTPPYAERLRRLQTALATAALDCGVAIAGPNLYYLTGIAFHLSERPVIGFFPVADRPHLIAPALEATRIEASAPYSIQLYTYTDEEGLTAARAAIAPSLHRQTARLGIELRRMRVRELRLLEQIWPQASFVDGDPLFDSLRLTKDAEEIELLRQAVRLAERALAETLPFIRAGVSEREVAGELTLQLLRAGADVELPFAPIVASGPNAALPHAVAGDRHLQAGDVVIIDWGAKWRGYCSDLTRVVAMGEPDTELRRLYELTLAANTAGRAAVRPGIAAAEVDAAARNVIAAGGYGAAFIHRLGHGLGLEVHEAPGIGSHNSSLLAPGMTFTIEPGIYLDGRGGVRIEDDVLVTPAGSESLSVCSRELLIAAI